MLLTAGGGSGETVVSWIGGALNNLWVVARSALLHITASPNASFFAVLMVSSLVVVAFVLIKKAKKSARA